jgi:Domain of unknown function (DUF2019)
MNRNEIPNLNVEQLVAKFKSIALAQDEAINDDQNTKYNQLFDEMELVRSELKQRNGDQRHLLLPLLLHPNAQVRLKSAVTLLAVDRAAAFSALQTISDNNEYPQAGNARFMLDALADGSYLPS